jgi:hypothetical protein
VTAVADACIQAKVESGEAATAANEFVEEEAVAVDIEAQPVAEDAGEVEEVVAAEAVVEAEAAVEAAVVEESSEPAA